MTHARVLSALTRRRERHRPVGFSGLAGLFGQVKSFIDITGASGATYRFQRIHDPAKAPATAGNFVFARFTGHDDEVVCCGSAASLERSVALWGANIEQGETQGIFVRLNVARAARVREHDDIVERHRPELVVVDDDKPG